MSPTSVVRNRPEDHLKGAFLATTSDLSDVLIPQHTEGSDTEYLLVQNYRFVAHLPFHCRAPTRHGFVVINLLSVSPHQAHRRKRILLLEHWIIATLYIRRLYTPSRIQELEMLYDCVVPAPGQACSHARKHDTINGMSEYCGTERCALGWQRSCKHRLCAENTWSAPQRHPTNCHKLQST